MQADQINENEMKLEFDARSVNEGFARMAVAAFVAELNPTLDEISDIKTSSFRGSNKCDHPRV